MCRYGSDEIEATRLLVVATAKYCTALGYRVEYSRCKGAESLKAAAFLAFAQLSHDRGINSSNCPANLSRDSGAADYWHDE